MVPTGTVAASVRVPGYYIGMATAIVGGGTRQVAPWICIVACCAAAAIIGRVKVVRAGVASVASPSVIAGACTVPRKARDSLGVVVAVDTVGAEAFAVWIIPISINAFATVLRAVH